MNFYINEMVSYNDPDSYPSGISSNNVRINHYPYFLSIEKEKDIPVIFYSVFYTLDRGENNYLRPKKEVIAMNIKISSVKELKAMGKAFWICFKHLSYLRLCTFDKKNYYVGKGVITDGFLNPYVLVTRNNSNYSKRDETNIYEVYDEDFTLWFSKRIYTESNVVVKRILRDVIPFFAKTKAKIRMRENLSFIPKVYLIEKPVDELSALIRKSIKDKVESNFYDNFSSELIPGDLNRYLYESH